MPNSLVIPKSESVVFADRSAGGGPKLIASEGSNVAVKEVPRIERIVAQKLVDAPVKLVGARF